MSFRKIQLGLRRLLLIIFTCAVWLGYYGNEYRRSQADTTLARTLQAEHSLELRSMSRIAVRHNRGYQLSASRQFPSSEVHAYESIQCFLPSSAWEICLATKSIPSEGFPSIFRTAPMRKGTSEIELEVSTRESEIAITVFVSGTKTIEGIENKSWGEMRNLRRHFVDPFDDGDSCIELIRLKFEEVNGPSIKGSRRVARAGNASPTEDTARKTSLESDGVLVWLRRVGQN